MTGRTAVAAALAVAVVAPLLAAGGEVLRHPEGLSGLAEWDRTISLAGNSAGLALLAAAVALPPGLLAAVLLERYPSRITAVVRFVAAIGLFVPLPVAAVAWQIILADWLPPLELSPGQVAWRPWKLGLLPAAWVHGAAAVPWVIVIASAALRTSDAALEEDAESHGGPREVWRRVLLPRLILASAAAFAWVAVQAATEIPVTDAMMVRSYAEEVYTQAVGGPAGLAGAVAAALPPWAAGFAVALFVVPKLVRRFGTASEEVSPRRPRRFPRPLRIAVDVALTLGLFAFAALPLSALVGRAAGGGLYEQLDRVVMLQGRVLLGSAAAAAVAGVVAAGLAFASVVAADRRPRFAGFVVAVAVFAWVAPGPLVGLGLKETIGGLVRVEAAVLPGAEMPPLRSALYDQPSPLPTVWAGVVRFFPVALVLIWPAARAIPRSLLDAGLQDGRGLRHVYVPLLGPAALRAAAAVAGLTLGEVSATKLVIPPHRREFVLTLFDQMHYGPEAGVAAAALVQVLAVASAFALGSALIRLYRIR